MSKRQGHLWKVNAMWIWPLIVMACQLRREVFLGCQILAVCHSNASGQACYCNMATRTLVISEFKTDYLVQSQVKLH